MKITLTRALVLGALLLAAGALPDFSLQPRTHLDGRASGLVTLFRSADPGETSDLVRVNTDGTTEAFVMPEGAVLVVTDLIATLDDPASAGVMAGGLKPDAVAPFPMLRYAFDLSQQLQQRVSLTGGQVFTGTPKVAHDAASPADVAIEVHGYLVKAK